jgi:hypothetical protein
MTRTRTLSDRDELFDVEQETITSIAFENQVAWGLDPEWMTNNLLARKLRWSTAYAAYKPRDTRTPLVTFEKNESRHSYESSLRQLVGILRYDPRVGNDDRRAMGICTETSRRSRNLPPDTLVKFEIDTSVIRRLGVHFRDAGSNSRAKPRGVHGATIRWAILPERPVRVDQLTNSAFDTRTPFVLEFEENQRGLTVYFCLCWESTTGQTGPWSGIVGAIIP